MEVKIGHIIFYIILVLAIGSLWVKICEQSIRLEEMNKKISTHSEEIIKIDTFLRADGYIVK